MSTNLHPARRLALAGLALAACLVPVPSQALQLTYELRIDPATTTPGLQISADFKSVQALAAGNVIGVQLYAIVNNGNALHTDDAFQQGYGSFVSGGAGTVKGDFRGDVNGQPKTQVNNVAPFNYVVAQSGFQNDLDGDGDLDLGSFSTGNPPVLPWFGAISNQTPTQIPGTGGGATPTEFLLGQATFTITDFSGASTPLNFVPRNKVGLSANLHIFRLDGTDVSLPGNSAQLATSGVLVMVPEPSALGMVLLGASGLAGWRRRR